MTSDECMHMHMRTRICTRACASPAASSTKSEASIEKSILPETPVTLPVFEYFARAASSSSESLAAAASFLFLSHSCNLSNVTGVRVVSALRRSSISSSSLGPVSPPPMLSTCTTHDARVNECAG